jgi:5-methylthioadenosine/S-adenosylhomocysteine deaminase
MTFTVIRNADWVVAWDAERSSHFYLRNADFAFDENGITFVGSGYGGPAEKVIEGRGRMLVPGFVNVHCHPASEPFNKGLMEERGSPRLGMSSLYEFMPLVRPDEESRRAGALFAVAELLRSGVTTFTDYSLPREGWLDDLAASGIRACLAPMYRSARWYTNDGHSVQYEWDEGAGRAGMEVALDLIDRARTHQCGRLSGMVAPSQVDTCTEKLLQASAQAARARGVPVQIHAAQSLVEFREMTTRHGTTPIEWLDDIGFLDEHAIIGHCIFVDEHSWIRWPRRRGTRRDLERMADAGASVAHCPAIFARRGIVLENFGRYRELGINIGIGTDTFPHNFVDELRWAAVVCKIAGADVEATSLGEVLHAGTVGGARALLREDLGRLAPGCKADFSVVDLRHPSMQPVRDPLKSLVFSALERPITDVFVDGRRVVQDGEVRTVDLPAVIEVLNRGQRAALSAIPQLDYARRVPEAVFPMTLP